MNTPYLFSALAIAAVSGLVSGLVAWGAMKAEMRALGRRVGVIEKRFNALLEALALRGIGAGRRDV